MTCSGLCMTCDKIFAFVQLPIQMKVIIIPTSYSVHFFLVNGTVTPQIYLNPPLIMAIDRKSVFVHPQLNGKRGKN